MDIISEAKKSVFHKLKDKNIELIIDGQDFCVMIEKDLMKILICNLVDNAIKASKVDSKIYIK